MLLHTVLAVVYGGLLVAARPDPREAADVEAADNSYYAPNKVNGAPEDVDESWKSALETNIPQLVMEAHDAPYRVEVQELRDPLIHFPDVDIPKPEPPHHVPWPPQNSPAPPHRPHGPPKDLPVPPPGVPPRMEFNRTIYQMLQTERHFSRVFKLVNATEKITKLLNDSSVNVTFFATPNWAFPKRKGSRPHHLMDEDEAFDWESLFKPENDIADILAAAEGLLNSDLKPNKDKLLKILEAVLLYETLPSNLPVSELSKNATFSTSLTLSDGSFDGQPLRLRVNRNVHLNVNLFATVVRPDIPAANGLIHVTNRFVLPPPSSFQIAFLFPDAFSVLSSAIQRVGLMDDVEWRNVKDGSVVGSPAVSFFAPTNKAFARLPRRLRLFLFSPFGERALKKLLQFHIVPEFVLHSNFFHNASDSDFMPVHDDVDASEFYSQLDYNIEDLNEFLDSRFIATSANDDDTRYAKPRKMPGRVSAWACECRSERQHLPQPPLCHLPRHQSFFPDPEVHYRFAPPHHEEPHHVPPHSPHFPYSEGPLRPPYQDGGAHCGPLPPPPPHFPPEHAQHYPPPPPPYSHEWPPFRCPHASPPEFPEWAYHVSPPHSPAGPHCPPPSLERPHHLPLPHHSVSYTRNVSAPTSLANHSLDVRVVQLTYTVPLPGRHRITRYETVLLAQGVRVPLPDISTRNGALHVVAKLLNPFKKPSAHGLYAEAADDDEDEWAGWEEWLPHWAEE